MATCSGYKYFPYVVLAWLVIGLGVLVARPKLAKRIGRSLSEETLSLAEAKSRPTRWLSRADESIPISRNDGQE